MAINLSNVNISLDQFQKLASGDFNAGEVALKGESKLTKINNHVHRLGANTKSISHEEVLAIKNAFVKALSSNGVSSDEINKIRKELGLAPDEAAPKSLAERSIKPLARQLIREIIDRNATAINASRAERGLRAFKTTTQLYGTDQRKLDRLAEKRADAAGSLNRTQTESKSIADFQKLVEGDAAEITGDDRHETLKMILAQRDAIVANAKGNPKAEGNCVLEYTTEAGQKLLFASGKSELDTIRMFDEAYLLLNGAMTIQRRNDMLAAVLTNSNAKMVPYEFNEMIKSVRAEATAIFGSEAVKQDDKLRHCLADTHTVYVDARKMAEEGKAMTAENFREAYRANCMMKSAKNLIERTVSGILSEMGKDTSNCANIRADIEEIMPKTLTALAKAKTADEAKAIVDGAMNQIRATTAKEALAFDALSKLETRMNEAFAKEMGVNWKPGDAKLASFKDLANWDGEPLRSNIVTGKVKADTPEEIEAEYNKLAQKTAHAHAEFLCGVDKLGFSGGTVDRIKDHLLGINTFKRLDLNKAKTLARDIDAKPLADAFAANSPMEKIFEEIDKLHKIAKPKVEKLFEGASEIGADEVDRGEPLLLLMAMYKEPGLAERLEEFLAQANVKNAIDANEGNVPEGVIAVNAYIKPINLASPILSGSLGKIVSGSSTAANVMRDLVMTAPGVPKEGSVEEKLTAFNEKFQRQARAEFINTFTFIVNKCSVDETKDGTRTENFDGVHSQFERDVIKGNMPINLPGGVKVSTDNYNTARDQLVAFITGDAKANYDTASANVKKQTVLLMSLLTQYGPTSIKTAFSASVTKDGPEYTLTGGRKFAVNPNIKPLTWSLDKTEDGAIKISMTMTEGCGVYISAKGPTTLDDTSSYEAVTIDATIPADNFASLADQDWTKLDGKAFKAADGNASAQFALIPENLRLNPTITATYHVQLEAPQA